MSDNSWRIKRYYGPRVLIDLAQLETSPFQALVLCLSGPERSIVQNLMQYAHRRSTFVSEYHDDYYLAPSEEEWDDIDALVAQLEDKLMNCEEFTQMLEDILTAAECACEAASAGYTEPYLVNYYRDLVDDGTVVYELPDGTPTVVEDDRCAVAQLVWAYQYEFLVETLQPLQEFLHTVLLAAVLGLIGTAIGGPIVGLSAASVSAFITALLKMGVDSDLENVENELLSLKEALVCAMYEEWVDGGTYADAAAAAADVSPWFCTHLHGPGTRGMGRANGVGDWQRLRGLLSCVRRTARCVGVHLPALPEWVGVCAGLCVRRHGHPRDDVKPKRRAKPVLVGNSRRP